MTLEDLIDQLQRDGEAGMFKRGRSPNHYDGTPHSNSSLPERMGNLLVDEDGACTIDRGHGPDDDDRPDPTGYSD